MCQVYFAAFFLSHTYDKNGLVLLLSLLIKNKVPVNKPVLKSEDLDRTGAVMEDLQYFCKWMWCDEKLFR